MFTKTLARPTLSPLAFCLAIAGLSTPSAALTLGNMQTHSFLGQPLHTKVVYRLAPDENAPELRCLKVTSTQDGLPMPAQLVLQVYPEQLMIDVRSVNAINEPLIAFTLHSQCGEQPYTRSYTVFLDPAPVIAPAVVVPLEQPAIVQVLSTPSPVPTAKPKMRWPSRIKVEKNSTVYELAAQYYPEGSLRYRRLLNALIAANPKAVDLDGRVAAGVQLRSSQAKKPQKKQIPSTGAAPLGLSTPASAPAAVVVEDKLTLFASEPDALRGAPKINTSPASYVDTLQEKVDTMQNLQLKMETEILQLRLTLAQLEQQKLAMQEQASAVALKAQRAAERQRLPVSEALFWGVIGAIVGGAAMLSFWLGRRGRRSDGYAVRHGSADLFVRNSQLSTAIPPVSARYSTAEPTTLQRDPNVGFSVGEEASDMDRAQFLLADGEVDAAIALLHKSIAENERDVERWLMLFHLFRERMMKTEYAQLALKFMEITPEQEDWELVCHIGRKIDPHNELYVIKAKQPPVVEVVEAKPHPAEVALDFLSAEAKKHVVEDECLNLDLDRLDDDSAPTADSLKIAQADKEPHTDRAPPPPSEVPDKPQDEDEFGKPCRY